MNTKKISLHPLQKEELPKEWKLLPVGKVLLDTQYGTNAPGVATGGTAVVGMKDIQDGSVLTTNLGLADLSEGERSKYLLEKGDVLINRTNSYDLVGKVGIYNSDIKAAFASYLVRLKADMNQLLPEYLNYWLNSYIAQKTIKRIATRAVSQANVNPTEFKKHCYIPLPPINAQQSIASVLRLHDKAFEKSKQLIATKEKQYQYLVSKQLNNSAYSHGHVRDITTEVSTRNRQNACERVLSVTNTNGFVLPEEQFERRVASADLSNYKIVENGQYAYNPSRINVGSIARLDNWDEGVLSPMYVVFKLNTDKVNSDFFLHWLSSYEARQRIKRSAQGSVRETVSFADLGAIPFPLPDMDIQSSVVEILNAAKREIDLLKQLAEKYKEQKLGLMQKLLTGEWRVNTDKEVAR